MAESGSSPQHPEISGWLYKWTDYLRGYQKRWFVLSHGLLSYYRNPDEIGHICQGSMSLDGATIGSSEPNKFQVSNGDIYHIRAKDEDDKREWVAALTLAKNLAFAKNQSSIISSENPKVPISSEPLEDLKKCSNEIAQRSDTESLEPSTCVGNEMKRVTERTSNFVASCSYISSNRALNLFNNKEHKQQCSSDDNNSLFFDCDYLNSSLTHSGSKVENTTVCIFPAVVGKQPEVQSSTQTQGGKRVRRTRVPDRPNISANLWSIIKSAIGKDLTKIPVPVNFSEPLSLLQRLTEDVEYSYLLDKASSLTDPAEQLAHVACFAITSYCTTTNRTGKPFNPLLGETFECDRMDDLGWKSIAEQVSHHPPIAAFHCAGKEWEFWQEQSMVSKFRGTYLQVIAVGEIHLKFKSGNHYAWKKVTTNIHNIIVGKLWIDQEGDMEVKCHTSGFKCIVSFLTPNFWGRELYKIKGSGFNRTGQIQFELDGFYDSKIEVTTKQNMPPESNVGKIILVWERFILPPGSEKYYSFSTFSCQLNEMEDAVAPTDSRNRPDIRLMEEGRWDEANEAKKTLEQVQRITIKGRIEASATKTDPYLPTWFRREIDPVTRGNIYVHQGEYWSCKMKKDWTRCPRIFV